MGPFSKKVGRHLEGVDERISEAKIRVFYGVQRLPLVARPFADYFGLVVVLHDRDRIAWSQSVHYSGGDLSCLIQRFNAAHFTASVHDDQNVGGQPANAFGLMKNVVFRDYEIVFRHVAKELTIFVKRQNIEFDLLGKYADRIVGCRRYRRLDTAALGKGPDRQKCEDEK